MCMYAYIHIMNRYDIFSYIQTLTDLTIASSLPNSHNWYIHYHTTTTKNLGSLESQRLQVFGHIWICVVTRHTPKACIGCRKIGVFKDALARLLLRNTLEVYQFRKCRNDLKRWENPLLMHEIFMCHHHLSFKFFRFATSSPHESNSRSGCCTRSRCQCGQTDWCCGDSANSPRIDWGFS